MMDVEKLIKRIKCPQIQSCPMDGEYPSCKACQKVYSKKLSPPSPPYRPKARSCGLNWSRPEKKNAGLALALLTECAPNPDCLGDDEWRVIRAEIEQMKAERDAAVEKIREWEKFDTYLLIHNLMPPEKWCDQKED